MKKKSCRLCSVACLATPRIAVARSLAGAKDDANILRPADSYNSERRRRRRQQGSEDFKNGLCDQHVLCRLNAIFNSSRGRTRGLDDQIVMAGGTAHCDAFLLTASLLGRGRTGGGEPGNGEGVEAPELGKKSSALLPLLSLSDCANNADDDTAWIQEERGGGGDEELRLRCGRKGCGERLPFLSSPSAASCDDADADADTDDDATLI
uniref:Uncharacterized protein n=1 Tax=Oryza nivara TaxID=4536 RepID=A0A0E0HMA9_ORYNI